MSGKIGELLRELKQDEVLNEVKKKVEEGEDVLKILEECRQGMAAIGDQFQAGQSYLAELILSGEIFKKVMELLNPYMIKAGPVKPLGKVVIATLKGDIHDLGKGIVVTLLKARGFEVYDLGIDVDPELVIEKVKEVKPDFVGFSCLLTPVLKEMKKTVERLIDEGLRDSVKVLIGGGVTTPLAKEVIGADFQTINVMEGVDYCLHIRGGK